MRDEQHTKDKRQCNFLKESEEVGCPWRVFFERRMVLWENLLTTENITKNIMELILEANTTFIILTLTGTTTISKI